MAEQPDGATSTNVATNPPKLDKTYYTWSTFFSMLTGSASNDTILKYYAVRDELYEKQDCERCEKWRDAAFERSPIVRFMQDEVAKLGGNLNSSNIYCKRCPSANAGGFATDYGILLCANRMRSKGHVEDTMAHEMVHAWDHLKFKVDEDNLRHQACTEIRASTLSGECRFTREFFGKSQWRITAQLQDCVRRRATLSLMNRPGVKDDVQAAKIVNEVWDSCFTDTRPFDEIYR